MTEKELLEYAAKAAGYVGEWGNGTFFLLRGIHDERNDGLKFWSPLDSERDIFLLIKRVEINIDFSDCCAWKRLLDGKLIQEFWGQDSGELAHAVLRAAAQIGKTLDDSPT